MLRFIIINDISFEEHQPYSCPILTSPTGVCPATP